MNIFITVKFTYQNFIDIISVGFCEKKKLRLHQIIKKKFRYT